LLQPDGKPPIIEPYYDGYGSFGEMDAFAWLAKANLPGEMLDGCDEESIRWLGIALDSESVFRDTRTGKIWSIYSDHSEFVDGDSAFFSGRYNEVCDEWGMSPNQALEAGILVEVPISTIHSVKYPLKFSFDPGAVYESLPASVVCPDQGC